MPQTRESPKSNKVLLQVIGNKMRSFKNRGLQNVMEVCLKYYTNTPKARKQK